MLVNGFARFQFVARFFEKGYHTTTAIMPSAYSAFYDMMNIQFFEYLQIFCTFITKRYIAHLLKRKITKVVSFHFAVSPAAYYAIKKLIPKYLLLLI